MQPPLLQAMQAYFGLPDAQLPVRLATLRNVANLISFSLQNMPKPNYQAVDDVRGSLENAGRFTIKGGSGNYHLRGEAHTEGAAKYFIHGTGVEEALRGWGFYSHGPARCRACFVYSDGSSSGHQLTPLGQGTPTGQTWWPCIVCVTGAPDEGWPFYCLALAWPSARAWGVHPERVRSLPGFQPQLLASTMIDTPTAALSTAAPSDTSSAAASSEMFDAGSDSGTEESDMSGGGSEAVWKWEMTN